MNMNKIIIILYLIIQSILVNISTLLGQDFSCIKLYSVSFHGNYDVIYDDDKSKEYTDPHWLDNNFNGSVGDAGDHKYPVCYKGGQKMKIAAVFKVDPPTNLPSFFQSKMQIKGVCIGNGTQFQLEAKEVKISGSEIKYSKTNTTENLPEEIQFYDPLVIKWSISIDGGNSWSEISKSENRVYVTLGRPSPSYLFYSCVHIACSNAKGLKDKVAVVNSIYSDFKDQDVRKVDSGSPLVYWSRINPAPEIGRACWETWGLLKWGNGRCGAFANFFKDLLMVHGVSSSTTTIVPDATFINSMKKKIVKYIERNKSIYGKIDEYEIKENYLILVKKWNLPRADTIAYKLSGVGAQGNPEPQAHFTNHAVVKYNNVYYDPSYGQADSPFTEIQWEDSSIDGFGILFVKKATDEGFIWIEKIDTKSKKETNFN